MNLLRVSLLAWLALFTLAAGAPAQEPYPARPITIVVPFPQGPPGSVLDLTARPLAAAMERVLKNPVGVVNKTGAGGAVGMQFVATSKPDGYTLLLAYSSISIIPEVVKLSGRPPWFFTVDRFVPIALISAAPKILVVPTDRPWNTARDFIDDAKKRPGQISFSSSGIYGTQHMAMELLSHAADIKLRHVPYAGAGPALAAILYGYVDALASVPALVLPQIKSGKLRPLASWGDERVDALPEVPTFRELGYRDVEFYRWVGLFAPTGAPEPILARLHETLPVAVADPEFKGAMDKLQTPIVFKQGEEFRRFFEADAKRLADGVRKVGKVQVKP